MVLSLSLTISFSMSDLIISHSDYQFKLPKNHLNLLTLNIHSLINKLDELKFFIERFDNSPDVIVITESWLEQNLENDKSFTFNLQGYNCINQPRISRPKGGGMCIYIAEAISFNVTKTNSLFNCNNIILLFVLLTELQTALWTTTWSS